MRTNAPSVYYERLEISQSFVLHYKVLAYFCKVFALFCFQSLILNSLSAHLNKACPWPGADSPYLLRLCRRDELLFNFNCITSELVSLRRIVFPVLWHNYYITLLLLAFMLLLLPVHSSLRRFITIFFLFFFVFDLQVFFFLNKFASSAAALANCLFHLMPFQQTGVRQFCCDDW